MSVNEHDVIERLHAVAEGFEMPAAPLADDVRRGRRRVRRNRVVVACAAAATVAVVLGLTATLGGGQDHQGSDGPEPVERPGHVVGEVPVWYDADGLHRGDVVEETPIEIGVLGSNSDTLQGALALVASGAVYGDPATGDVWLHPWGGEPRVVGHGSKAGPGGDPTGDTAAWFEGKELVVYDTETGREVSRTVQTRGVDDFVCCEHRPPGNGFLQVSAERVVWVAGRHIYIHDVRTQSTSVVQRDLEDVHDNVEVFADSLALVLTVPGRAEQRYPGLEGASRLSPSGSYVLGVEDREDRHGAVIIDVSTGELWPVPKDVYPWIAWSYGHIAMVDHTEDELLACDAESRTCKSLPAKRPFLMPTN